MRFLRPTRDFDNLCEVIEIMAGIEEMLNGKADTT